MHEQHAIAEAICDLADSVRAVAKAIDRKNRPLREPKWAKRLEAGMTALSDALIELDAASDEIIGELEALAAKIEEAGDVSAATEEIRATAQRLRDAQPDAPAPDPGPGDPGDGGDVPPADGGDVPPADGGDLPPA